MGDSDIIKSNTNFLMTVNDNQKFKNKKWKRFYEWYKQSPDKFIEDHLEIKLSRAKK